MQKILIGSHFDCFKIGFEIPKEAILILGRAVFN
jgi:hypothetical protein